MLYLDNCYQLRAPVLLRNPDCSISHELGGSRFLAWRKPPCSGYDAKGCYSDGSSDDHTRHLESSKRPMSTVRPSSSRKHKRKRNCDTAGEDDEYEVEKIWSASSYPDKAMGTDEAQRVLVRAAIIVRNMLFEHHLRRRRLAERISVPPCTLQHQPALSQGSSCPSALCIS
jgi:hypothetical protein